MSRTNKDKKVKHVDPKLEYSYGSYIVACVYRRLWVAGAKPKLKRSFVNPEQHWYKHTPSYWVLIQMTAPKRAKCKAWEKTVVKAQDFEDIEDCPDYGRKPHIYYY